MCQDCKDRAVTRRNLLRGGAAASLALPFVSSAYAQEPGSAPMAAPASPDEALQRLVDGNKRYVDGSPNNTDHSAGRYSRSQGQQPFAAVVACSDSRVIPELIFDQAPGDLFVVRVAGNFLNEDGIASLEFATAVLGIQAVLVLGHTSCGAISATITSIEDNELPPGHLPSLVNAIRPAVYDVIGNNPENMLEAATAQNAIINAEKAVATGPILSDFAANGKIKSSAGVYDIATGVVTFL
tara:strand:- start:224 stop:943 length:720 start_codon:yes stop_codon:yes gene_type:complete